MAIINTRFSKICTKCNQEFTPDRKYQKICRKCNPTIVSRWMLEFAKTQNKRERAEKLRMQLSHVPKDKNEKDM